MFLEDESRNGEQQQAFPLFIAFQKETWRFKREPGSEKLFFKLQPFGLQGKDVITFCCLKYLFAGFGNDLLFKFDKTRMLSKKSSEKKFFSLLEKGKGTFLL